MTQAVSVLLGSGCHNKVPQTRRLKQETFTFSQFWRLAVQDQAVGKAGFSRLVRDHLLAEFSHGLL